MKNSLKYMILQYVPFLLINQKIDERFSNRQGATNFLSTILSSSLLIVYLASSFSYHAPMFSKEWAQKRKDSIEQQQIQETLRQQESYRQEFYILDKNKDCKIDSTEFIYRR
jgi:hypothetical protein